MILTKFGWQVEEKDQGLLQILLKKLKRIDKSTNDEDGWTDDIILRTDKIQVYLVFLFPLMYLLLFLHLSNTLFFPFCSIFFFSSLSHFSFHIPYYSIFTNLV